MLHTQEHIDLMNQFEKDKGLLPAASLRFDREEDKEGWARGHIYQHGLTNQLFLVYRMGYAYGKCYERNR